MDSGQPSVSGSPGGAGLDEFLAAITRLGGVASAAEAIVATSSAVLYRGASGFRVGGEPLLHGRRFDAASLTKPWMATLAILLEEQKRLDGSLSLDDVFDLPGVEKAHTRGISLDQLLCHESGIAAWAPLGPRLGRKLADADALAAFLLTESFSPRQIEGSPLAEGRKAVYSDLGYLLWGLAAERVTGRRLADLLDAYVCDALGVAPLGALASAPPDPVECRLDNLKEVELAAEQGVRLAPQRSFHLGVAQDGNSRALGRLSGHAGLFVTADEMLALGREWLAPSRLLTVAARDSALSAGGASYSRGWARWSADGSSGPGLAPSSFGHTGFTGGSLWVDPERRRIFVLLAHRLASRIDFNPFRREFHRLGAGLG